MLLLGSSTTTDTNDLSQADFLKPDAQLREEAISDPDVIILLYQNKKEALSNGLY